MDGGPPRGLGWTGVRPAGLDGRGSVPRNSHASPKRQREETATPKICRVDNTGKMCTHVHMTRKPDFVTRTEPIAFFLTWTTYGSWLPGDDRGWADSLGHLRAAEPTRTLQASRLLAERPLALGVHQQSVVADVIAAHCKIRGWTLHAISCRSQHVHVVVTAAGVAPEDVMTQFKAWATRRLKAASADDRIQSNRRRWWSECGSKRWIYDVAGLEAVVTYVTERQDKPRS
jgi:hypothetical protein